MTKDKEKEVQHINVEVELIDNNEALSASISELSKNIPSLSGLENRLERQNEILKSLNEAVRFVPEPDVFIQASAYVSVGVAVIGLVVAFLGAYLARRQYAISSRTEKTQIYNDVIESLWFFSSYTGKDVENIEPYTKKIHRNKVFASKVFGESAGDLIQKVLQVVSELPAQYMAFENVYGDEISELFLKFGLDPKLAREGLKVKYIENRLWLQKGVFKEFEKIFEI